MRTDRKTRTSSKIGVYSRGRRLAFASLGALFVAASLVHSARAQAPAAQVPAAQVPPAQPADSFCARLLPHQRRLNLRRPPRLLPRQSPSPQIQAPGSAVGGRASGARGRAERHASSGRRRPLDRRRSVAAAALLHAHVFGRRLGRQSGDDRTRIRVARDLDGVARQDLGTGKGAPRGAPRRAHLLEVTDARTRT